VRRRTSLALVSLICSVVGLAIVGLYLVVLARGTSASAWLPTSSLPSLLLALLCPVLALVALVASSVVLLGTATPQPGARIAAVGMAIGMVTIAVALVLAILVLWGALLPQPPG
jgi:hypothetical protein